MNTLRSIVLLLIAAPLLAHPSVSVVRDSEGNVYYSDLERVWMITPEGNKVESVSNVHTHELHVDAHDQLHGEHLRYLGDSSGEWEHYVWRRSPGGHLTSVIPPTRGFRTDHSFVRDASGAMYRATRDGIQKHEADGTTTVMARHALGDPRWMTAAPEGTVFLIDGGDLIRVRPDGTVSVLAANIGSHRVTQFTVGRRHDLMGLWLDGSGSVFVANFGARRVLRVTPDGDVSVVYESTFPWSPTGGLATGDGGHYVLETSLTNAVRVTRIDRDGKRIARW